MLREAKRAVQSYKYEKPILWDEISKELQIRGAKFSGKTVTKFKNLKQSMLPVWITTTPGERIQKSATSSTSFMKYFAVMMQ